MKKKKVYSLPIVSFLLAGILAGSSLAANRVVVVPLGGAKATGDSVAADVLTGKTFSSDAGVGLTGTLVHNPESTGDAVAADVLAGKTFSNSVAVGLTGTYEEGSACRSGSQNRPDSDSAYCSSCRFRR